MFIKDVQKFINRFKIITEAVTLPQIRRGIVGKEKEFPVIESDKEWYEDHKSEILSTLEKVLNVDDKTLKIKLQKFDTDDFFTNDKPRKLKVKEFVKSLRRNFVSQVERGRNSEDKSRSIEAQYEMMEMKNGVEVYAVYTPMANRYLTHTKLHVEGCFRPTWCIASSTANNFWNTYHLYDTDFPSVFIVCQKKNGVYNPIKYELKCDPFNSLDFDDGDIDLKEWVDEWRNPGQEEENYEDTSLFDEFDISCEDLENTIRKLINTVKASSFSEKYGRKMINRYGVKIRKGDEDEKMQYLVKACKNGTITNFKNNIDVKEMGDFLLDELIRYNNLTEYELETFGWIKNKNAFLNIIKNKRCSIKSLNWANNYYSEDMIKKVYLSLPEEVLLDDNEKDVIFSNIKEIPEIRKHFIKFLLTKNKFDIFDDMSDEEIPQYVHMLLERGEMNNAILYHVLHIDDKKLIEDCVECLISNGNANEKSLRCLEGDAFIKCIEYVISNKKIDKREMDYSLYPGYKVRGVYDWVNYLIKNDKFENKNLIYLYQYDDLVEKGIDYLKSKNEIDKETLQIIKDYKKVTKKNYENVIDDCFEFMISKNKIDGDVAKMFYGDEEKYNKCLEIMLKTIELDNDTLKVLFLNKNLLAKAYEQMKSKNKIDLKTLKCVKSDEKLFVDCFNYLLKQGVKIDSEIMSEITWNKSLFKTCYGYFIRNGGVSGEIYDLMKNNRELLGVCIDYNIENKIFNTNILRASDRYLDLMKKYVLFLIDEEKVNNFVLHFASKYNISLSKCLDIMIKHGTINKYTLSDLKGDKELYEKCKRALENQENKN